MKPPEDFTPYPWQEALASEIIERQHIAIVAAPGSGKTAAAMLCCESLSFICPPSTPFRALIIAPPGKVCAQWRETCNQWGLPAEIVGGRGEGGPKLADAIRNRIEPATPANATILPWSRLKREQDSTAILSLLQNHIIPPWDILIVDESHLAQSVGTSTVREDARKKRVRRRNQSGGVLLGDRGKPGLRHFATYTLGLTGTPATADPRKMRAQLLLANLDARHPILADKTAYESKYWNGRIEYNYAAGRKLWVTNDHPSDDHHPLIREAIYHVDFAEIQSQLPAHRRVLHTSTDTRLPEPPQELIDWVSLPAAKWAESLPTLEYLADIRREDTETRGPWITDAIRSWHGEADARDTLLLWCEYQDSADLIGDLARKAVPKSEGTIGIVHGGLPAKANARTLHLATSGRLRVLVATHASCGTGTDGLQQYCSRQIFAEAPRTPGSAEQVEGRIVRTGQTMPVITEYVADGTEGLILRGIGIKAEAIRYTLAPATTDDERGGDMLPEDPEPPETTGFEDIWPDGI